MASFVVMEPPGSARSADADSAVLVRDGFSFVAFLVPPLWLLWHRLWIEAALAVAAALAIAALGEVAGFGLTGGLLSLLVSTYVGLEGSALRLAALARRGWRERGVVEAGDVTEAEIRLVAAGGPRAEDADPAALLTAPAMAAAVRTAPSGPALGLFQYPGRP